MHTKNDQFVQFLMDLFSKESMKSANWLFYCSYETTKNEEKVAISETLFLYLLTTVMLRKFHILTLEVNEHVSLSMSSISVCMRSIRVLKLLLLL